MIRTGDLLIVMVMSFVLVNMFYWVDGQGPEEIPIERRWVITDKYEFDRGYLFFGSHTIFVFELSNQKTIEVRHDVYHNYEIGDFYFETIGYYTAEDY